MTECNAPRFPEPDEKRQLESAAEGYDIGTALYFRSALEEGREMLKQAMDNASVNLRYKGTMREVFEGARDALAALTDAIGYIPSEEQIRDFHKLLRAE